MNKGRTKFCYLHINTSWWNFIVISGSNINAQFHACKKSGSWSIFGILRPLAVVDCLFWHFHLADVLAFKKYNTRRKWEAKVKTMVTDNIWSSETEPPGVRVLHKRTWCQSTTSMDCRSRSFVCILIIVFLYAISRAPRRCGQTLRARFSNFTAECRCISEQQNMNKDVKERLKIFFDLGETWCFSHRDVGRQRQAQQWT